MKGTWWLLHALLVFCGCSNSGKTVSADIGFKSVSHGTDFECAVYNDRFDGVQKGFDPYLEASVDCEGNNELGQLDSPSGNFDSVSAGFTHACAVTTSGGLECWGSDTYGEASPPTGSDFVSVSAGINFTCGLSSDGTLECWGEDGCGQVAATPSGTEYESVSAGGFFCATSSACELSCW